MGGAKATLGSRTNQSSADKYLPNGAFNNQGNKITEKIEEEDKMSDNSGDGKNGNALSKKNKAGGGAGGNKKNYL